MLPVMSFIWAEEKENEKAIIEKLKNLSGIEDNGEITMNNNNNNYEIMKKVIIEKQKPGWN